MKKLRGSWSMGFRAIVAKKRKRTDCPRDDLDKSRRVRKGDEDKRVCVSSDRIKKMA